MTEMPSIAESARSWLGTRFHHQGRLKKTFDHKGGVDCLGLLVGIACECDLRGKNGEILYLLDEVDYSHTPDTRRLMLKLNGALTQVSREEIRAGDVVLMHVLNSPQHLGVIVDGESGLNIIHAYAQAGEVVEHQLTAHWKEMITAVFRAWN